MSSIRATVGGLGLVAAAVLTLGYAQVNARPVAEIQQPPLSAEIGKATRAAEYDLRSGVNCVKLQVEGEEVNYQRC